MVSFLYSIDVSILRWINQGWSSPGLDSFFSYITEYQNYYLFLVFFLLYLWVTGGSKGRWLVWSLIVAVALSDETSAHVFKLWVERVRPCNALEGVLTPAGKSFAFSFPSNHAANVASSMFLLTMAFRSRWPLFLLIALLIGISRIYLGLHYPSDVLGGYVLGTAIGYGVWMGMEKLKSRFNQPLATRKGTDTKSTKKTKKKSNVYRQDTKSAKKGKRKAGI